VRGDEKRKERRSSISYFKVPQKGNPGKKRSQVFETGEGEVGMKIARKMGRYNDCKVWGLVWEERAYQIWRGEGAAIKETPIKKGEDGSEEYFVAKKKWGRQSEEGEKENNTREGKRMNSAFGGSATRVGGSNYRAYENKKPEGWGGGGGGEKGMH